MRVDKKERLAFNQAANIAGISLSSWMRERLRWAATKELENASISVEFLLPGVRQQVK
jgi:uncharacterized protein (DUF1778 family)